MDALIAQLRDGTVTLRRNRRKTPTSAALKEMFETLELSRKQNRNSRMLAESHMNFSTRLDTNEESVWSTKYTITCVLFFFLRKRQQTHLPKWSSAFFF